MPCALVHSVWPALTIMVSGGAELGVAAERGFRRVSDGRPSPVGWLPTLQDEGHEKDGVGCWVNHWGAEDAHLRAQIWAGRLHATGLDRGAKVGGPEGGTIVCAATSATSLCECTILSFFKID